MTKHTPGPWIARKVLLNARNGEDDCAWAIEQPEHMPHATVFDRAGTGNDTEAAKANARLIAAAPELLEAIREVVGFFDCAVEINALQKMALLLAHLDDNLEEIKRLQTAIAKATGEDK